MVRYGITEEQVERMRTEIVVESDGMDIVSEQQVPYTATEYRMGEPTQAVIGLQNAALVLLSRRQDIAEKQQEQRRTAIPAFRRSLGSA